MTENISEDPFDPDDLKAIYEEEKLKLGRVNIVIIGKTGVGKSTLLNTIFGVSKSETSLGKPCTSELSYYFDNDKHIGIYDTIGFELSKSPKALIGDIEKLIKEYDDKPTSVRRPHLVWFCSAGNNTKVEDGEFALVNRLTKIGIPVIYVLTQAPTDSNGNLHQRPKVLAETVIQERMSIVDEKPFILCAEKDEALGMNTEFGIKELVQASFRLVPEYIQEAFGSAQIYDLEIKDLAADKAIKIATTAAASIGAIPVPFADAPGIIAAQTGMMMRIAQIYNLSFDRAFLVALAATSAASSAGRSLVGNLFKFIPLVGTVIGGLITGAVAGSVTFGVGKAWKDICRKFFTGELDQSALEKIDLISSLFLKSYKKNSR